MKKFKLLVLALFSTMLLTSCGLSEEAEKFYNGCKNVVKVATIGLADENEIEDACYDAAKKFDEDKSKAKSLTSDIIEKFKNK